MAHKSYGIYYNGETAIGVEVEGSGSHLSCNTIEALANARGSGSDQLTEVSRKLAGSKPLAMALCGTMYISHDHRSEFEDLQQAAMTLRFDIEDHLAVDADNIAISYQEKPTQTSTVDLLVYTANRQQLSDTFGQMEKYGADPLVAMPAAAAWQTYLANAGLTGESAIFVGKCGGTLHIMILNEYGKPVTCRKFPVSNDSSFHDILRLELNRCSMTALPGMNIETIYYHSDDISMTLLSDIASDMDLKIVKIAEASFAKAAAIGAALSIQKGTPSCNFRADNMEPESIKKNRYLAKMVMSGAACLILLCWICMNMIYTARYSSMSEQATDNIAKAAKSCGINTQVSKRIPVDLERKLRAVKKILAGNGSLDRESATNTFNLTLRALSKLDADFDLNINSMTFKPNEVKPFSGSVPNLEALKKLREILENDESELSIAQETSKYDGDRQIFEMPLMPGMN